MRTRLISAAGALAVAVGPLLAVPAAADEPVVICTPTDQRIAEASGLVRLADGFAVVNDGGESIEVFILDDDCAVREVRSAPVDPYDVEDLAIGPDGTLWLADIGDNRGNRATVAVEILGTDGTASVHRLTYPDGPRDAEAMLVDSERRVVIVTKALNGVSGVYRSPPIDPEDDGAPALALTKVGEVSMKQTGTPGGPVGPPLNNLLVTGAAQCADRIALRTYTDLYLWTAGADLAATVVGTEPQVIALPPQQQGESVALSADCTTAYVHGEGIAVPIHAVALPAAAGTGAAPAVEVPVPPATARDATNDSNHRTLWVIGSIAFLTAIALGLGFRFRRG